MRREFLEPLLEPLILKAQRELKQVGKRDGPQFFAHFFFLPCFLIAPLLQVVPSYATAPVLILVGFLMFSQSKELFTLKPEDALTVFITLIIIPLTFSITQGLVWGIVLHLLLYLVVGRRNEIKWGTVGIALIGFLLICIQNNLV